MIEAILKTASDLFDPEATDFMVADRSDGNGPFS